MKLPFYHENPEALHIGTEEPRAYFIPYDCLDDALSGNRNSSYYLTNLSGEIPFKFFESFAEIDEPFYDADYPTDLFPTEPVPGCWQMGAKYDKPLYSNLKYPYPTDPPYVPDKNPCGAYFFDVDISAEMLERTNILTFEGVSSCFYLWVNGKESGYSQVSHCTSEFDISSYLTEGKNRITVLVVKWCDGSYLEDQDFFRLSGIFREVYILSRNKIHIRDVSVKKSFNEDFSVCDLTVKADVTGKSDILYGLASPDGSLVSDGESDSDEFSISIPSPRLWNDETPYVYTLFLTVEDEIIPLQIALIKAEINGRLFLINGKPVKLKGINRHDSSPVNGYAVTIDEMKADLLLLKRANVNCIRTSHYPNDPRFPALAEALGFYLVDEADLETHGMGFNTDADWDWTRWSYLSNSEAWRKAYIDRAKRLYERDKNCGCVIMWSLGNESGCGVNHRAMREYIKCQNPAAIVHYENAHLEFKAVPEGENFSDISDVESRMYAGINYINDYLKNPENSKPFFLCEYVCSMSTGDAYDYWKTVDKFDNFTGGCIWELTDHAVDIPDSNGSHHYLYGGDFGDFPNDNVCCIDGMIFPDRTPRPGYFDMKKIYEPFSAELNSGVLTIKNKRYFSALSDLSLLWSIDLDTQSVLSGEISTLDIEPGAEKQYRLFKSLPDGICGNCFFNLTVKECENKPWCEKGYEVGFFQKELDTPHKAEEIKPVSPVICREDDRYITVNCGKASYIFDKPYGRLSSIKSDGKELLKSASEFTLWHAPTYNRGSVDLWRANHLDHTMQKTYESDIITQTEHETVIHTKIALGGPSNPPVVKMTVDYVFTADGKLALNAKATVRQNAPVLPRLGWILPLTCDHEKITYFGRGPTESYPDRFGSCRLGLFSTTVNECFTHYVRPQENGAHIDTRYLKIGDKNGNGLYITGKDNSPFIFHASHISDKKLAETAHDFELTSEDVTYITLDARFNAISENAELDTPENNRLFDEKEFEFGFEISVNG